jgi:hypothetical protein
MPIKLVKPYLSPSRFCASQVPTQTNRGETSSKRARSLPHGRRGVRRGGGRPGARLQRRRDVLRRGHLPPDGHEPRATRAVALGVATKTLYSIVKIGRPIC